MLSSCRLRRDDTDRLLPLLLPLELIPLPIPLLLELTSCTGICGLDVARLIPIPLPVLVGPTDSNAGLGEFDKRQKLELVINSEINLYPVGICNMTAKMIDYHSVIANGLCFKVIASNLNMMFDKLKM